MCGINGFLTANKKIEFSDRLATMNNLIFHRGPDSNGEFIFNDDNFSIAMAMRRLSIIDLDSGNQPMYSDDQSIVIVFNGEIYNFQILKEALIIQGVVFKTNSDTEVILRLYEQEGPISFGKLDGMFAFSIFDKTLGKVFIARDFFGEKPLYYTHNNNEFLWASELKSIISVLNEKPEIDSVGLSLYFQLTYIPAPYTIYEGIKKLEANHYIELNCNENRYSIFEIFRTETSFSIQSVNEAKKTYKSIKKSVKKEQDKEVNSKRTLTDKPLTKVDVDPKIAH